MTTVGGADDDVWLPRGAPRELHDFIHGDSSSVEIDTADVRWLPTPIDAPVFAEPSLSIRAGSTPTTVTLEVAWSRPGPATSVFEVLIVDGRLGISSNGLVPGAERQLSAWVAAVNRQLSASDRQLESLRVQGSILIVTTRSPFPPPRASSATPAPVALAGLLALRRPTAPVTPWQHRTRAAKLLSATAIFLLICGGAAVVTATWLGDPDRDSGPPSSTESTPSTSAPSVTQAPTTAVQPVDCAIDPDADECALPPPFSTVTSTTVRTSTTSSPTTSTVTTTTTTTTTTLPPGPCATDPDADVAVCPPPGPPPSGDSLDGGVQCVEPDVAIDVDNDGITDRCIDVYTEVIPPTGGLPTQGEAVPPRPIPATGSDSNVPLQLGVLLILAGMVAMVAGHRRAGDERS